MPTWGAVGLGKENAEVEPEEGFASYDETLGVPPRSPYLCLVKQIKKTETGSDSKEPGTPMVKLILEIAEPRGTKKALYNGYPFFVYRVVNSDWAGRVNQMLKAFLGNTKLTDAKKKAILEAFWDGKVVYDKDTDLITKIGTWTIPETLLVGVTTRKEKYEGDDRLTVQDLMSPADAPKGAPANNAPADEDEEEVEDAPEGEEEDEEVAERQEELAKMTVAKLKVVAKGLGAKLADYKALEKDDLVNFILDLEFPIEDEPEEVEEEEADEDEEEADEETEDDGLDEMSRTELKAHIKTEGLDIRVTTKKSDDDLRAEIRALDVEPDEEEEESEEDEAEPEPAKPVRRGTTARAASPARAAAKRRTGGKDQAPF